MTDCPYLIDGRCSVAETLVQLRADATLTVPVSDARVCPKCRRESTTPSADVPTPTIVSLAAAALRADYPEARAELLAATRLMRGGNPRRFNRPQPRQRSIGVGDVLTRLFRDRHYPAKKCSGCNKTRREMNRHDVAWCRANVDALAEEIYPHAVKAVRKHATWGEWLHAAKDAATAGFSPTRRIRWLILEACDQWERDHPPPLSLDWTGPTNGRVVAIVPLFNPAGFDSRVENYVRAVEHYQTLGFSRVLTVEAAFPGQQPQSIGDRIVIQASDRQRMWQKERLINLGLDALRDDPPSVVCWPDADLEWPHPIAVKIFHALRDCHVLQPFEKCDQLKADGTLDRTSRSYSRSPKGHPGYVWAARWSIAARGLYDAGILGGGDRFIVSAWKRQHWHEIPDTQRDHWREWWPDQTLVAGYMPGVTIKHHWHGSRDDRGYHTRNEILAYHAFDPTTDIRIAANGLWEWTGNKRALEQSTTDYFRARREDKS